MIATAYRVPPLELFPAAENGRRRLSDLWCEAKVNDRHGLALYLRHYSSGKNIIATPATIAHSGFAGPGEKMVLLTPGGDALFVWRVERFRRDGQEGVNCSVFRNEGATRSSELIRDACRLAWDRWPGARLFTFVNPAKVRSTNPGYCFKAAAWRRCGTTRAGLVVLELMPTATKGARDAG